MSDAERVGVVGGGITGLAATLQLVETLGREAVALYEREARLGGAILTEQLDGFVIEAGPDSFVTFKPAAWDLCRRLGLEDRLQGTRPDRGGSFIKRGRRLLPMPAGLTGLVPSSLWPLLTTPLLSLRGKLRAALEFFVPRGSDGADESLAQFAIRRFGPEVYDWLIEPLLAGIHAGDGRRLSIAATYPNLHETEQQYGGMLRQMLRAKPRPAPAGKRTSPFLAPANGVGEIVTAIERTLPGGVVHASSPVESIQRSGGGYRLCLDGGMHEDVAALVLAVPAHVAARLIEGLDARLAALLREIPFVSTATVSLGYRTRDVTPEFRGSGYLSPRAEGGPVVACTWVSNKFAGRAAEGSELLRVFVGRAGLDDIALESDETLTTLARDEIRRTLGITAEPVLVRVHRWPHGIPQYTVGHLKRVGAIEDQLRAYPGLVLAGASYRGAGLPDCILSGQAAARRAIQHVRAEE